ncbi:MAG TPA: mannose-1-phosphate guanylyltransferase [Candidatus Fimivivens sp.]|nr:mannose-1-phosphate guanylyltransferase [Candidatus Fimivivens sp.]
MKTPTENLAIVIMAGGSGTRLWPLSRKDSPKQFQSFVSEKTLLEETYDRAKRIVPEDRIFISSGEKYRDRIFKLLPNIAEDRLLLEPSPRGTGPAIGLVASFLHERFPGATIATIASDHAIENDEAFVTALRSGLETIARHPDKLAVVGINPTSPDTGLGYIRMGEEFTNSGRERTFYADEFKEKPDQKTAETYLADWRYLWNAGYFIFSADTMLGWIAEYAPKLSEVLMMIGNGTADKGAYDDAEVEAIEPLVVERLPAESRIVVPAPIQWSDIGTWRSLFDFLAHRNGEKSFLFGDTVELEGAGNLAYGNGKKIITLFGVDDLVVVDTDDALLVTSRDRAADIKKLISELKDRGRADLL